MLMVAISTSTGIFMMIAVLAISLIAFSLYKDVFQKVDESQFPPQATNKLLQFDVTCRFGYTGFENLQNKYEYDITLKSGSVINLPNTEKVMPVLFFRDSARTPTNAVVITPTSDKRIEINTPYYFPTISYATDTPTANAKTPATLSLLKESVDCATLGRTQTAPSASEFISKCADLIVANVEVELDTTTCTAGQVRDFTCRDIKNKLDCDARPSCYWGDAYGGICQDCGGLSRTDSCNLLANQCKCGRPNGIDKGCFVQSTSSSTTMCANCIGAGRTQAPNCEQFTDRADCLSGACQRNCKWENNKCARA